MKQSPESEKPPFTGIIFIVYNSNTESKDIEIDEINEIVNSITVNKP